MLSIIGSVISLVGGGVSKYMDRKSKEADAKHESKMTYLRDKAAWEKYMAQGSMTSWKDEYWTIIISIPMIAAFIPPAVPWVLAGFVVLSDMPQWYLYFVGISFGAAFGVKPVSNTIVDALNRNKVAKKDLS